MAKRSTEEYVVMNRSVQADEYTVSGPLELGPGADDGALSDELRRGLDKYRKRQPDGT